MSIISQTQTPIIEGTVLIWTRIVYKHLQKKAAKSKRQASNEKPDHEFHIFLNQETNL